MPNIKEALMLVLSEEKEGKIALEVILKALRSKAMKGDVRAAQELLDRAYGKAMQFTDVTSAGQELKGNVIKFGDREIPI